MRRGAVVRKAGTRGGVLGLLLALLLPGCSGARTALNRANTHFSAQRYRQALTAYRKVVKRYPRSAVAPHAQLMVGVCYGWLAGDLRDHSLLHREAQAYRRLIRRYPRSPRSADAHLYLAQILSGHVPLTVKRVDCARAIPLYKRAAALAPKRRWLQAQALGRIGQCYAHEGKHSRALARFRQVARRFSDTPWGREAVLLTGTALFAQKRFDAALKSFLRYRSLPGRQRSEPLALLMLGLTYGWLAAKHQRPALLRKSETAYRQLIARHGKSAQLADALLYLGQAYAGHTGVHGAPARCKRALPYLRRAVRTSRRAWIKAQALGRIGQCQARAGQRDAARATYRHIINTHPQTPWARIARQLYDALGPDPRK